MNNFESNKNTVRQEKNAESFEKFGHKALNILQNINLGADNLKDTVEDTYSKFEAEGLFSKAKEAREKFFGKEVSTYGVVYRSDFCISRCSFCPAGHDGYKSVSLGESDITLDTIITLAQGHEEVCYLQADVTEDGFMKKAEK
jgi:2-iminoacetate synthase ThiH